MFIFVLIFLIGFLFANMINFYLVYGLENPFSNNIFFNNNSKEAPYDFIKEDKIEVFQDKVIIHIDGASLSRYAPTGSMIPVLDEGSNGIRIKPRSEEDVHIGDIITFEKENELIVHRVIEKGIDEKGIYYITKGDNNDIVDGKTRFKDIKYITIGILW